jgi:hypothetical protein
MRMLEKLTMIAFGVAFMLLAFLLVQKEKFGYVVPVAFFGVIACLASQSWFQGVFKTQIISVISSTLKKYGEKLDDFQKTTADMQTELAKQQAETQKAQRELSEAQRSLQIQQKKIESVELLVENLFSRTCFETISGSDTQRVVIQPLDGDRKRLFLKLEHVPLKKTIQCLSGGNPFLVNSGMLQLSPMQHHRNVAYYGEITGDGNLRTLTFAVQYVKDVQNTNLVKSIELRDKEVFLDGTKVDLDKD